MMKGLRYAGPFILFLAAAFMTGYLSLKQPALPALSLVIEHPAAEQIIWNGAVREGEKFQIRYIHSVDHLPVQETYQVRNGSMVLDSVQWISFGAGLDYWGNGKLVLEDEWVKIKDMNREVDVLPLRVGTIADHTLLYRDSAIHLWDYVEGLELVHIFIKNN